MKLQYLGDSKDSFKWDYHDFLVSKLNYSTLNIVPMMTPDDLSSHGKADPSLFPARKHIISFCRELKKNRTLDDIKLLPNISGNQYSVKFHKADSIFNRGCRDGYFFNINAVDKEVIFVDPDVGFEPEKSCSEQHIQYMEIEKILDQVRDDSIISVFQHHRRKPFGEDYARIKERLQSGFSTAIYWHSLMFVAISKSKSIINNVVLVNRKYLENTKSVKIIV